ncbi:MAG: hypothetical protein IT581_16450 [Verrucomicrobiales bacterium]|nr:hypothetical protein [Verrucomicrobiales bacterium]
MPRAGVRRGAKIECWRPKSVALAAIACALSLATFSAARADGFRDDFVSDPSAGVWSHHGDRSPSQWDAGRQRLAVTWDSSAPNRFFLRALSRDLTRADDIRLRFRLGLDDIATADPNTTFPISIGLIRRTDALGTNSFRGAGVNPTWGPRNLMEFAYVPASRSITPTLSATAVASHNLRWSMVNLFPFELTPGAAFEVELQFTSASQTLAMAVTQNGAPWAQGSTILPASFGEFRLDAVSINSYSGEHQPAGYGGQVIAHGWIDDVEIQYSEPPTTPLNLTSEAGAVVLQVTSPPQWNPALELSADLHQWAPAATVANHEADTWRWKLSAHSQPAAFFRLRWERP